MITITVHHHHQPTNRAPDSKMEEANQENKLTTSACNTKSSGSSSSIQVQYSAAARHLHFRESSEKLNRNLPLVSTIGNEIDNNNNFAAFQAKSVESLKQTSGLIAQSASKETLKSKSNQSPVSIINCTNNNNNNNKKLHSRSISLVINPEFSSDSSTESASSGLESSNNAHLHRRRSVSRATRRTRLLLVGSQPALHRKQVGDTSEPLISLNGQTEMVSRKEQQNNLAAAAAYLAAPSSVCLEKLKREENMDDNAPVQASEEPKLIDSIERFRQAGIILRNISDEFFR